MGGHGSRCARLALPFLVALALSACADRAAVTPAKFETSLNPGARDGYTLQVALTGLPRSYAPLDIVFLFDATGSMNNIIDTMRKNAVSILQQIKQANPNAAFAIASFGDYDIYKGGGPVWTLNQNVTQDIASVVAGLERIQMVDGGDYPEAYGRALYEMIFLNWRPGAQRYVILFGDAPAHDSDFYGKDFGIDPGRDGIVGTADDLRFRDVVRQLSENKIRIIGIYDQGSWSSRKPLSDETRLGFEYLAKETAGLAVSVSSADEVPNAIRQGFAEVRPSVPVVRAADRYVSWLTITSGEPLDAKGLHYRFPVSVTPPIGTASGVYDIPLRVMAADATDAVELGSSTIRVRIGWLYYPWRWALVGLLLVALAALLLPKLLLQGPLLAGALRMTSTRAEKGLIWRGTIVMVVLAVGLAIAFVVPETAAELLKP